MSSKQEINSNVQSGSKRPPVKRITNGKHKRNASTGPNKRPAFILKLWNMVNDPANEEFIQWTPDGESFKVLSKENFEKEILPKYFKHSNYSSFVRQLNMYGWHKVQDITAGAIQSGDEIRQFKSPYFIRGREDLLDNIVRNKSSKGSDDEDEGDLGRILDDLELIKMNQMDIASDLNRIRSDNQMLWRECYDSRERHKKHAETFERILRFLASLYTTQGKFVNDTNGSSNTNQKQQRLLLPNIDELSNNQITELSTGNFPLSAIQEMISNNAENENTFRTPSKTRSRISSIVTDENNKANSHVSDGSSSRSTDTSPQSYTVESPEETHHMSGNSKNNQITLRPNSRNQYDLPTPSSALDTNIFNSPSMSASTTPMSTASPMSLQKQAPTLTPGLDYLNSPNLDAMMGDPLVSDALYGAQQGIIHDDNTEQQLLSNSRDIDSIIKNINMHGESLNKIQEKIQKLAPNSPTAPVGFESDPSFDVDEFLMNTSGEMDNFEDMAPPVKKTKVQQ